MELTDQNKSKNAKKVIVLLSVLIPLVVAVLFKVKIDGVDLTFLPSIYAGINATTAIVLLSALFAIKNKKIQLHKGLMQLALVLSVLFLGLYVAYHMTTDSTVYGDTNHNGDLDILEKMKVGATANFYYVVLATHIVLSIVVIPLVLFTYLFALQGDIVKHKKWNRYSFPIWLYVAISGVVVYFMISPFY